MSTRESTDFAFPRQPHYYVVDGVQHFYEGCYGLSLRDYFAATFLGTVVIHHKTDPAEIAANCYVMADAMLAERAK